MTDSQNDVPCRDCKRPTQHATERCDECRTPAGRILAALTARGIKGDKIDPFDVLVGQVRVSADDLSWCLMCEDGTLDHDDNIEAAANAIAAIVQAPELRSSLAPTSAGLALAVLRPHTSSLSIVQATRDVVGLLTSAEARAASAEAGVAQMEEARRNVIDGLIADVAAARRERDTLAAENARLRAELEKPVAGPWIFDGFDWLRRKADGGTFAAEVNTVGWHAWHARKGGPNAGLETGDAGRHAADLALVAAGYRLIGGVHPLPSDVPNAR